MIDSKRKLIREAEKDIRAKGYAHLNLTEVAQRCGVSTDEATALFSTADALAVAVASQYATLFFRELDAMSQGCDDTPSRLTAYFKLFAKAYASSGKACLCGQLSTDASISPALRHVVESFVDDNIKWLESALAKGPTQYSEKEIAAKARLAYAAMQGSMSVAALKSDPSWIDSLGETLRESNTPSQ